MRSACQKVNVRKALLLCLCFTILVLSVSACSGIAGTQATTTAAAGSTQSTTAAVTTAADKTISFPIKDSVTLTYWISMNSQAAKTIKNYQEMLLYQELAKRTGVKIEFIHPAIGQETDQFNIMVASQKLPDLIYYPWYAYPGGIEKANKDGVVTPLNGLLKTNAPNLSALLAARKDISKDYFTDSGTAYSFPCLYEGALLQVWFGPTIRKDWLDKLSLKVPQTISEWHDVLAAFKTKDPNGNGKADEIPFVSKNLTATYAGYCFLGSWNINSGFYNDQGKVKFGAVQPEFKEWLTVMRQWYKEGLIDPDFAATDGNSFKAKITGNLAGSYFGSCSGNLGAYTTILKQADKNYTLVGTVVPALKTAGDNNVLCGAESLVVGTGTAITSANKHPELSAQWLDYLYGKEGNTLVNFGVEGVTYYKMADGTIHYTDTLIKDPNGLSLGDALSARTHVTSGGPFMEDEHFWELLLVWPQQNAALAEWSKAKNSTQMPPVSPSSEDSQKIANILSEVNTYVTESVTKMVMGQQSIDTFDQYVSTIKNMNLEQAITIEQKALDKYLAR